MTTTGTQPSEAAAIKALWAHVQKTLRAAGVQPGDSQYVGVVRAAEKRIAGILKCSVDTVREVTRAG